MSERKVRIGVVGVGFGQRVQIPAFQRPAQAQVVAVCSQHLERAEATAKEFGIPLALTDYRELVGLEEVDLVSIVTPPHLHHPMVMAALDAGKHVLCEKPMALNLQQATEMYQRAEEAKVVHMVDHELRFNPVWREAKSLLDQGYLGRPYHVLVQMISQGWADPIGRPWGWTFQADKGGGALLLLASHLVDALRWWFGEVQSVTGNLETYIAQRAVPHSTEMRSVETEDVSTFVLQFANGVLGVVFVSFVAHHPSGIRVEFYGDEGSLLLDPDNRLLGGRKGDKEMSVLAQPALWSESQADQGDIWSRSFAHLAQYLVETVYRGRTLQEGASFYDGKQCQAILDAIARSHAEGRRIELM